VFFVFVIIALIVACHTPSRGNEYFVSSAGDIERLTKSLAAGDVVVMKDGAWNDQTIAFRGKGTAAKPITLRAATAGKVVLTGNSSLTIDGEHLVVSGLWLQDGGGAKDGVAITGRNCRLTQSAITNGTYKFFVHLFGAENRIDHCYLAGKTSESPTLQIEADRVPNRHRVDHNHFGPRPPLGRNGGETIRIGYSHQSMNDSITTVESNLFEHCDGENEIVSNKSCGNIYRGNTFFACAGTLTLRHGNRCLVDGNFFFGHGKRGSGGIRVIGEDHIVINNYIEAVTEPGIWITAGIPNSELKGYFQARNCLIAFNTLIECRSRCLDLAAGLGRSGRTLLPENITVANNLFVVPENGALLEGKEGEGWKWLGNLVSGRAAGRAGMKSVELKMVRGDDGVQRPGPESANAIRRAEGSFDRVTTDIDGQPRTTPLDVGADQLSTAPVRGRPLRAMDVGPSWIALTSSPAPAPESPVSRSFPPPDFCSSPCSTRIHLWSR
jgi:poly(beta-D-mannuronate) lyase